MRFCPKCQAKTERLACGRCRPCNAAYCATKRATNLEKNRAYDAAYYAANVDKKRAYYAANREALRVRKVANRAANRARDSASKAAYRSANPETARAIGATYRARKRNADGTHTPLDVKQLFALQKGKCACCQASIKPGYHVDHIMPLALKGRNDRSNLQLLCPTCNLSKGARHPVDFMQQRGFLL